MARLATRLTFFTFFIILLSLVSLVSLCRASSWRSPGIKQQWYCRKYQPDGRPAGGFLAHMLDPVSLNKILNTGKLSLADCADCSGPARTCSAWTYMRDDLIPMLFIYPASPLSDDTKIATTPRVGLLVNAKKFSKLVTAMAVIDAASDDRNGCAETRGTWEVLAESENTGSILISPPGEQGRDARGASELLKSGGGPTRWMIANYMDCGDIVDAATPVEIRSFLDSNPQYNKYRHFYIIRWSKIDCSLCNKPFICKTEGPPGITETRDVTWAQIGNNGQYWADLFGRRGGPLAIAEIMNGQCKWLPRDWETWVQVMKKFYADHVRRRDREAWKNSHLYASPCTTFLYMENEANVFVDKHARREQDKLLRDSLLGVFFVDSTCEQQLQDLGTGVACGSNGGSCVSFCPGPDGEAQHFLNEKDRCQKFLCGTQTIVPYSECKLQEKKHIEKARKQASQLVDLLNSQEGPAVQLLRCNALSPTFINSSKIEKSFDFDEVFQIIR
mgnify:CR=1 FL=1|jgi:hypothetical protein